ncbi:hypothetical protein ACFO0N_05915 [Halobium salinum]|uniref:Uncharacterized protein n=1 Tax=Halobium salinum TaxID=1364940 RepID=A0ABD5PAK4_9EURY|nr:hypothetical protein [Halobium salinum]
MVERDLGQAKIVYDDPEEGVVERVVQNEHAVHVRDHWVVRTGEDAEGNHVIRRIPRERVHYVERSTEEFKKTVESMADDIKDKLGVGGGSR